MKKFAWIVLLLLAISCGANQAEKLVAVGNYDRAIEKAARNLRSNKHSKAKQPYISLLHDAYTKSKERDLRRIDMLAKDGNPQNFEEIFSLYVQLNRRQEIIRPLLPLRILTGNQEVVFEFDDYSDQIINSKNTLANYLYENSSALLETSDKTNYRKAYDDLVYLEQVRPNYKDAAQLRQQAQILATDYISVYTKNDTRQPIPRRLESDLLDFSTNGLNRPWTVYHSNRQQNINYDFGIIVNFRDIAISPDNLTEKQYEFEKEIVDGKKKLTNRRGQVVLDSLGNPVMVDNIKRIRATVTEFTQEKSALVAAKIDYIDFANNQLLQSFPVASEFLFRNTFGKFRGDRRAIDPQFLKMLEVRPLPFPTAEQMVYDTGEDLKSKIKNIIVNNPVRR